MNQNDTEADDTTQTDDRIAPQTNTQQDSPARTHAGATQEQPTGTRPLDDPVTHAKNNPLKTALIGLGILAVLMNWVRVSAFGGGYAASGLSVWQGQLFAGGLLTIGGAELAKPELRKKAWLYGGVALTVLTVGTAFTMLARIGQMQQDLGMFSGAVNVSVGVGLWLAVAVSLGILYVGYQTEEVGWSA